jgi:hypothetical protein
MGPRPAPSRTLKWVVLGCVEEGYTHIFAEGFESRHKIMKGQVRGLDGKTQQGKQSSSRAEG